MEERTTGDGDPKEPSLSTEEYEVTLPQVDETNEDLIGLSQEEYERKRLEREHLLKECENLIAEGERLLKKGEYESSETLFRQAASYCPENSRARQGILACITQNFQNIEPLLLWENASLASGDEVTRKYILKEASDRLAAQRELVSAEAAPLRNKFQKAQRERRESFHANRNYYGIRLAILSVCLLGMIVGCIVSAFFIARTKVSTPIVLSAAFGALAAVLLVLWLVCLRKLLVAQRLCRENERLSSTEEGARLQTLEEALKSLALLLDGEEENS